jgi:hypothetical protein
MSSVFTVVLALFFSFSLLQSTSATANANAAPSSLEIDQGVWIKILQTTGLVNPVPSNILNVCRESEILLNQYPSHPAVKVFRNQFTEKFRVCHSNFKNWKWSSQSSIHDSLVSELEQFKSTLVFQNAEIGSSTSRNLISIYESIQVFIQSVFWTLLRYITSFLNAIQSLRFFQSIQSKRTISGDGR